MSYSVPPPYSRFVRMSPRRTVIENDDVKNFRSPNSPRRARLNAMGRILHPLAGLEPELPTPTAELAVIIPAMTRSPGPEPTERGGALTIVKGEGLEGEYIDELFTASRVWRQC